MIKSLKYAKILEDSGLTRKQAETHIQILSDVIGDKMATKDDLNALRSELTNKIQAVESKLSNRIDQLETKMTYEFQSLEHRMTLKLGGLMAAFLATGLTAAKLLFI